jgi:copper chaperone
MKSHELKIQGMNCSHCVAHVKNALDNVVGLEVDDVQVGRAKVWYDDKKVSKESIAAKIDEAGYRLVSIQ